MRQRHPEIADLTHQEFLTFVMATIFAGDVAEHTLPDLLNIIHEWAPDVILRESCEFAGWLAAEIIGLPHASVEVTLFAFYSEHSAAIAASLTDLLSQWGQPTDNVPARLFKHLHLSFVPPSFEDPAVCMPPTAHALRPVAVAPLPDEPVPSWLATLPDRPTVYATGGTAGPRGELFEATIAGVRTLEVNLIATVGGRLDPEQFGPQPGNVHLARYISQSLLLPRCAAVVTHGGFSSVLGPLANGIPLVILPYSADHAVNAGRAAALGTAVVLDKHQWTPECIRTAVRTVLGEPRYQQRARQVQAEIEALPGPERGVELIAQLVGPGRRSH